MIGNHPSPSLNNNEKDIPVSDRIPPEPLRSPGMGRMLQPGEWVRHSTCPSWGEGQVQSVVGHRVTVNFEHAGKVLIDVRHVDLEVVTF